jgi:hypothetical protein
VTFVLDIHPMLTFIPEGSQHTWRALRVSHCISTLSSTMWSLGSVYVRNRSQELVQHLQVIFLTKIQLQESPSFFITRCNSSATRPDWCTAGKLILSLYCALICDCQENLHAIHSETNHHHLHASSISYGNSSVTPCPSQLMHFAQHERSIWIFTN